MSAIELFVWYRCPPEQAAHVLRAAAGLLARAARECGVQGRLLAREDAECTWMEHYVLEGGSERLAQLLDCMQQHWPADLPQRHPERFQPQAAHVAAP